MAKTSISIAPDDLAWLREQARKHHRGNLSAAIAEATRLWRQQGRIKALMEHLRAPALTDADRARIDRELDGAPRSRSKRGRRAA